MVIIINNTLIIDGSDATNLRGGPLLSGNKGEALGWQVRPQEAYLLLENLQVAIFGGLRVPIC